MPEINDTVEAIFSKAMYLIDAQSETDGQTNTGDTREYRVRTIGLLNTLIDEVLPLNSDYVPGGALPDLNDFTDMVALDPFILRSVLPNGLAARLLSEENPALASFFEQKYEENKAEARRRAPATFEPIATPYGGIEHGEFSRW